MGASHGLKTGKIQLNYTLWTQTTDRVFTRNEEAKLLLGLFLHRIIIRLFWFIIRYYLEVHSWNPILCAILISLLNMMRLRSAVKGIKWLEYRFQVNRKKRKKKKKKTKLWCVYLRESWEQWGCGISLCASTLQRNTNINQNHLAESVSQGQMLLLVLLNKEINEMCPEVR